jgi:hypothetical protein
MQLRTTVEVGTTHVGHSCSCWIDVREGIEGERGDQIRGPGVHR